jgi:hypothetical protein
VTAFNSTGNSGSVSFTDAYGTVALQPSASDQFAIGFARNNNATAGAKYFEMRVIDAGGDPSKLTVGFLYQQSPGSPTSPPANASMFGETYSGAQHFQWNGAGVDLLESWLTTTISTGDIWMFWVQWSADATLKQISCTAVANGTYTGGASAMGITVGRNGVWFGTSPMVYSIIYPAYGQYGWTAPAVVRDASSASAAVVALDVTTISFHYTPPCGALAWGDGPQGTSAPTINDIHWDPATITGGQTLTNSNYNHQFVTHSLSASILSVKSTALPSTGKRVIEFWGQAGRSYGQTLSASGSGGTPFVGLRYNLGLCEEAQGIGWPFPDPGQTGIVWGDNRTRRGIDKSASMTGVQTVAAAIWVRQASTLYVDFDALRIWQRRDLGAGNIWSRTWAGRTISAVPDGPNPYLGIDGMTFSASTTLRAIAWSVDPQLTAMATNWVYLNAGQQPFITFPLLPGWVSMDGSRQAYGVGSVWDTSVMPSSISVCFSGLGVRANSRAAGDHPLVRNTIPKSSGKLFFNIFCDVDYLSSSMTGGICLLPQSVGTFTAATIPSMVASCLFYAPVGPVTANMQVHHRVRYGVTMSYTQSSTTTTINIPGGSNVWLACAVDFDVGKVWFGAYNPNRGAIGWRQGADPASGTLPDMTFTASTTMYIAVTPLQNPGAGGAIGWWYLVAESANVVGMPTGFNPWNGDSAPSATVTPSGAAAATSGILWPYGVVT